MRMKNLFYVIFSIIVVFVYIFIENQDLKKYYGYLYRILDMESVMEIRKIFQYCCSQEKKFKCNSCYYSIIIVVQLESGVEVGIMENQL